MQNLSSENVFRLGVLFHANQAHAFKMKRFVRGLVLKQLEAQGISEIRPQSQGIAVIILFMHF